MKKVCYCPSCGYAGPAGENKSRLCPKCQHRMSSMLVDNNSCASLTKGSQAAAGLPADSGRNSVASLILIIAALVYGIGALAGLGAILVFGDTLRGLVVLAAGLISGTLLLGFSEVIRLLDVISKK